MDNILYIIIIIILTVMIIFYGGHNFQNKIEYESNFFNNINNLIIFEKKLQKYSNIKNFINTDIININNYVKMCDYLIPNFLNCYFIKINAYSLFNIYNIIDLNYRDSSILIIFNHNKINNLELLINNKNIYGYFYNLNKKISITSVYPIFNNSNTIIYITIFVMKKPFWHS